MESNKRHRISSLEDLKVEFVEKRRKTYLEDLEIFCESTDLEYSYDSNELQITSLDWSENDKVNEVGYLSTNNVDEILVFPEFITCSDHLISEEVSLISNSLFFVRPDGDRVLIHIKNYLAKVYDKCGNVLSSFQVKSKGQTILDCVDYSKNFSNLNNSNNLNNSKDNEEEQMYLYYILDVLMINGSTIATSELECRLFFLDSIIDELNCLPNVFFKVVKYKEVDVKILKLLYNRIKSKKFQYETDSLIFVNKMATYVGGYNPNWLCYRDQVLNHNQLKSFSKYCLTDKVTCKLLLIEDKLYTFDNVLIGEVQGKYKSNLLKILVNEINDFKINYKVIGQAKGPKIPDSLRKIYVNFVNHLQQKEENFNKILNYLNKNNN